MMMLCVLWKQKMILITERVVIPFTPVTFTPGKLQVVITCSDTIWIMQKREAC